VEADYHISCKWLLVPAAAASSYTSSSAVLNAPTL
jgi:hypothetical protein